MQDGQPAVWAARPNLLVGLLVVNLMAVGIVLYKLLALERRVEAAESAVYWEVGELREWLGKRLDEIEPAAGEPRIWPETYHPQIRAACEKVRRGERGDPVGDAFAAIMARDGRRHGICPG